MVQRDHYDESKLFTAALVLVLQIFASPAAAGYNASPNVKPGVRKGKWLDGQLERSHGLSAGVWALNKTLMSIFSNPNHVASRSF